MATTGNPEGEKEHLRSDEVCEEKLYRIRMFRILEAPLTWRGSENVVFEHLSVIVDVSWAQGKQKEG